MLGEFSGLSNDLEDDPMYCFHSWCCTLLAESLKDVYFDPSLGRVARVWVHVLPNIGWTHQQVSSCRDFSQYVYQLFLWSSDRLPSSAVAVTGGMCRLLLTITGSGLQAVGMLGIPLSCVESAEVFLSKVCSLIWSIECPIIYIYTKYRIIYTSN